MDPWGGADQLPKVRVRVRKSKPRAIMAENLAAMETEVRQ